VFPEEKKFQGAYDLQGEAGEKEEGKQKTEGGGARMKGKEGGKKKATSQKTKKEQGRSGRKGNNKKKSNEGKGARWHLAPKGWEIKYRT